MIRKLIRAVRLAKFSNRMKEANWGKASDELQKLTAEKKTAFTLAAGAYLNIVTRSDPTPTRVLATAAKNIADTRSNDGRYIQQYCEYLIAVAEDDFDSYHRHIKTLEKMPVSSLVRDGLPIDKLDISRLGASRPRPVC